MGIYLGTVLLGTSKFLFLILVIFSLKVQGGGGKLIRNDSLTRGKDIALHEKVKPKHIGTPILCHVRIVSC